MARNVSVELNREADRKGLTGERREQYIGGAWERINEQMPWLNINTANDLYDYFAGHNVRRMHGHAA